MNRLAVNQELVKILDLLVQNNPDLRFSQILAVYGFVTTDNPAQDWLNEFYCEPEKVLARVNEKLQGLKS
jgi:hypothetical protein